MCIAPEVEEVEELEELEALSYLLIYISSSRSKIKVKTVPPLPGCLSHKAQLPHQLFHLCSTFSTEEKGHSK